MPVNDLSIYELDMQTWWDDGRGPMAPLHWLTPSRFAYFKQVAAALEKKQVLDIGCGGGLLAERFADAGAQVVGGDLLWSCVHAAQAHARAYDARIKYVQMRAE